ncbi:MAG: hypothetical protein MJ174_02440 [Treponema sp.]|nr:hypothetical protein [Treponema sp.]
MKKIILVLMIAFGLSTFLSANDFKKSAGVDISFTGLEPNFYMHSDNLEFQAGLSFSNEDLFTGINAIKLKADIGYCSNIGNSDFRFGIGFTDSLSFCFDSSYFSTADLFGMYVDFAKPLDSKLELGAKLALPLVYTNVGTDSEKNKFLFPGYDLFSYTFYSLALEIRFYFN